VIQFGNWDTITKVLKIRRFTEQWLLPIIWITQCGLLNLHYKKQGPGHKRFLTLSNNWIFGPVFKGSRSKPAHVYTVSSVSKDFTIREYFWP
jgi:hypothetical protein